MKRFATALCAAALLTIGTAVAAGATTLLDEQSPTQWVCPGFSGVGGSYNPAANPIFKGVADKLGMSTDALANELRSGKSLSDISKAKNVDPQSLVDLITAPQKDMMAIRVKYGFLTQTQADEVIKNMAAAVRGQLDVKGFFGGAMMGGFGGMMGGGYGPGGMMGGRFGPGAGQTTPGNGTSFGPGMMGGGFGGMMGRFGQNRSN